MFLLVSGRRVGAHLDGHQHGVSIQISINLSKKFLHISFIRKIVVTRILTRVFAYLSSYFSQIVDFIYRTVLILFRSITKWRDNEKQQLGEIFCYSFTLQILLMYIHCITLQCVLPNFAKCVV